VPLEPRPPGHRPQASFLTVDGLATWLVPLGECSGERPGERRGPDWPELTSRPACHPQVAERRNTTREQDDPRTTRRRNRTFQAGGCPALPVLKTGWATCQGAETRGVFGSGERWRERRLAADSLWVIRGMSLANPRNDQATAAEAGESFTCTRRRRRCPAACDGRSDLTARSCSAGCRGL
jgi:hypothetical protein